MSPTKPFDTYKWRWLSVQPTEGLLNPPVFLGVLRVLARHEGVAPAAPEIAQDLLVVQQETHTPVNLVRYQERNLIRNSGQYWKGTGLLAKESGQIRLTSLGRLVANRMVTQAEFAAIMVQQTVLPNPWTYTPDEISKWEGAHLKIRPLALILEVMAEIGSLAGQDKAFLSPRELIKVVIPLAGARTPEREIADAVIQFRRGVLNVSGWPDCAPASNDRRLAREFLLFLCHFGLCQKTGRSAQNERYYLDELPDVAALTPSITASIFGGDEDQKAVLEDARHSDLPSLIERQRTLAMALKRPGQTVFRRLILQAYHGRCFLSGETIPDVLEAAHIVPVEHGGADDINNGICLRVDLHRLFDSGKLRLRSNGDLAVSAVVAASSNYQSLPARASIPGFVSPVNVHWRESYM